jgi:hypothetical protein
MRLVTVKLLETSEEIAINSDYVVSIEPSVRDEEGRPRKEPTCIIELAAGSRRYVIVKGTLTDLTNRFIPLQL